MRRAPNLTLRAGSIALRLSGTDLIKAAVIAHPGGAPVAQVNAIKVRHCQLCRRTGTLMPDLAGSDPLALRRRCVSLVSSEPPPHVSTTEDQGLNPAARKAAEEALAARKPNGPKYEFVDYEVNFTAADDRSLSLTAVDQGTTHGFAARPALEHPKVKAAFEQSFTKTVEFFSGIFSA